jgi:hypothetical protein
MKTFFFTSYFVLLCRFLPLSQSVNFTSSNLPIVVIQTNGQSIMDEPKILAEMKIIDNGIGQINHLTDVVYDYDGYVGIEYRGQVSQGFPKKSYGFETLLTNNLAVSKDVSLQGMPLESDWILFASAIDGSFLNNVLTYNLGNRTGQYASRTRYVEVVLNGNYHGLFVLCEKIKRGSNRVKVSKLKVTDVAGINVTGGYIVSMDVPEGNLRWASANPSDCQPTFRALQEIVIPKTADLQTAQGTYIRNYITGFENLLYAKNFNPTTGYQRYIDLNSFVDYFLVSEITKNLDGYSRSTYYYKDKDKATEISKLKMGPLWDYDLGYGNGFDGWTFEQNMARTNQYTNPVPFWWEYLVRDTAFVHTAQRRWKALRQNAFSNLAINAIIDSCQTLLAQGAASRDGQQWGNGNNFSALIQTRRTWIDNRLNWLDNNISQLGYYIKPYNITEFCVSNTPMLEGVSGLGTNTWSKNNSNISFSTTYSPTIEGTYSLSYSFSDFTTCNYTFNKIITRQNISKNTSVQSGDWDSKNTWSCGVVPNITQNSIISDGHRIILNVGAWTSKITFGGSASALVFKNVTTTFGTN